MIQHKIEIQADSDNSAALEDRSMAATESLPCQDQHSSSSSREGTEPKSRSDQASVSNSESSSDYDSSRPSSARILENTSSLRQVSTLPRNSSMKSKKPQIKKKMKKPRPTSHTSISDSPSPTRMSDMPLLHSKLKSTSQVGLKSGKVLTKTTSLRPVRILTKMASLRSKKSSMRKCSEDSQIQDSSVGKATCSSTFKNSKFPKYAELQPEGAESAGTTSSAMKVCPYTYCSLHGHHHDSTPPLKRFVSIRRRMLRSQKSMKPKIRPSVKAKNAGDAKKVIRVNKMATVRDAAILETANSSKTISPAIGKSSIVIDDGCEAVENLWPELEESEFCDNAVSTSNEEIPVDVGEVHEGTISSLNSKHWPGNVSASVRDRFDEQLLQGLPPLRSSQRNRTTALAGETRMEKEKHISMWRLLHHSLSSSKVSSTQLRPDGGFDNINTSLQENISGQDMGMENIDAGNQKIELDAIKLVEEAIDEILLPEVQDQLCDARSITSDINSDEEESISTSANSAKDSLREESSLEADNINTTEEKKTVPKVGSKSDQPMPKNWSKLKKLIMFKRFIKALDKVRKLNFREPQHLPLEPDRGAERVKLRPQTAEERKRAEEWMLDYALRQVVGNLTPTRRRKVELLVEAFETVIPVSGNGTSIRLKAAVSPCTKKGGTEKETSLECCHIESDMENPNAQETDTYGKEDRINASKLDNGPGSVHSHPPELRVPTLYEESLIKPDDFVRTSPEEVPVADKVFEEVNEKIISNAKTNSLDVDSGSNNENLKKHDSPVIDGQSSARSASQNIDDCQDSVATKTAVSSEDTILECDIHEASKTQLDKQKYMKMWRVIYHQVVSGSAAQFGSHQHLDRADKGEQVDDACTPDGEKYSSSLHGSDVGVKHHTMHQNVNFSQIEAIKLVEKAIDEIVLPEIEEQSSDDQSIPNDIISDKDFLEKNDGEGGKLSIPTSNDSAGKNFRNAGETPLKDDVIAPEQERMKQKIGSKSSQQRANNWSNLKKLILLNRFVKALEKVREFNPQEPRSLPLEPDPEEEKINLRHQTIEERKSADEWMIDNAIQQVVARLTPARKRRVELLVEAFETVTPLSDIGTTPKHSTGQRFWPMRSPGKPNHYGKLAGSSQVN